jgi:NADPH:quinone reductase
MRRTHPWRPLTARYPFTGLQLRTLVTGSGELNLSLVETEFADPAADEVVIQVQAAPINPSDLALLIGPADLTSAHESGDGVNRRLSATIPPASMLRLAGRLDRSLAAGSEGAGLVIAAGGATQAMIGKTVAVLGRAMYAQYLVAKACVVLPPDASASDGASIFAE